MRYTIINIQGEELRGDNLSQDFTNESFSRDTNLYRILSEANIEEKGNSLDYIEKSLKRDLTLIQAIQFGNKEQLEAAATLIKNESRETNYYANPIIQGDSLRTRKNGMVIRNTLCRIGAAQGGVPAIYLHLVSEKYAIQIEQANTEVFLDNVVSPNMLNEFCDLVINFSMDKYSKLIKDIVNYIGNHISEELNVTNLSELFHVNKSHLARKFKKETGYTISEYVNLQKIEAAKLILQGKEISISEIAEKLGYNSSSYFSKTFKKMTGQSPLTFAKDKSQ